MKYNRHHIRNTLLAALRQGTSPRQLALTCALGAIIGIFPIWGTTTWICLGIAILLRLNIVILQLVNYIFFPIQLLLIYPFVKAGVMLFGLSFNYTASQFLDALKNDFWKVATDSGAALLGGASIWALCSVPVFFIVFYTALFIFQRTRKADQRELKSQ